MDKNNYYDRAKIVWQMEARAIEKLAICIEPLSFGNVVNEIKQCVNNNGRIFITGKGTSGAAGKKISHTLCCVDIPASFISIGEGINAAMGLMKRGDLLIMFSKGGSSKEVLNLITPSVAKGIKTIGITSNPASQLALKCDMLLKVSVEREVDERNELATSSTIAMISTFDAIAVALSELG